MQLQRKLSSFLKVKSVFPSADLSAILNLYFFIFLHLHRDLIETL